MRRRRGKGKSSVELKEVWQRFALFDPSLASDHIKDPHQLPFIEKHISGEYCLLMVEQGMQLALHIQYYRLQPQK